MQLTQSEQDELRRMAPRDVGLIHFEFCPLCGGAQWACTDTNKPVAVTASVALEPCYRCRDVQRRAPEVFNWVLSVIGWKDKRAEIEARTPEQGGRDE